MTKGKVGAFFGYLTMALIYAVIALGITVAIIINIPYGLLIALGGILLFLWIRSWASR